mmetsp:Transcript_18606/g.64010  ORF Transcript_18606/g.64010 Transcript_18606/m.64010 type:complete len:142 (+) Transcript_18606:968-1393(+)
MGGQHVPLDEVAAAGLYRRLLHPVAHDTFSDRPFKRPCAEEEGPARDSGAGAQKARTTPLAAQVLPTVSPAVPAQQVVYNFSGADLRGANFSGANFGSGSIIMGPTAHVKLQPAKEDTDDEDDASYNCDYDDEDAYGCDGS